MPTMTNNDLPLSEAYFLWLCNQVGLVERLKNKTKTHWTLLGMLHRKEFTWPKGVPLDENRAEAGKHLRVRFLEETGYHDEGDFRFFGCDMLELLIVLSWDLAWNSEIDQVTWFWKLIENLGLLGCNDAYPPSPRTFNTLVDRFINRDYDADGSGGGLFPLREPAEDQRDVELHYQAQAYLLETAPI